MPRDMFDLAASIHATANGLPEAQQRGVYMATKYTANTIRGEIRKITGDMRLSGVGKKGVKVNAWYEFTGKGTSYVGRVRGTKYLRFIEEDTKRHRIPRLKSKKKKYAVVDGHPYHHAYHPGTKGQHPFKKGVEKAAILTPRIFQTEVRKAVSNAWGLR